ncbi:hypothetical protein M9H77_27687 [Catharanthus roseus]|uniref:Uncharacterized protein n=1 Tax=Catharanthus roseus TaxID=4058 RepID=A0ACC0AE27_CATRO|nr:hypothetical protein M9H77_27687 [Catharanthus roseus]
MHLGLIVPDVLTRQHEHRSGLIWSEDHETCITDLQCRRFGQYSLISWAVWFTSATSVCWRILRPLALTVRFVWLPYHDRGLVPSDLWTSRGPTHMLRDSEISPSRTGNNHTYWETQHVSHVEVWHQWRQHIRDDPVLPVEDLSSPKDDYIRWYWNITLVYIGNPANCDTHTVGYKPAGMDRWMMEVDDMVTRVIQGPPSSPKQTLPVRPSCRHPRESVADRGAHGVKKGTCRLPGGGACGGHTLAPPHLGRRGHANPRHGGERGERFGGHRHGDLGSSDHDDPFDPSFSLGLTPHAQSHPGGLGTSYAPPLLNLEFSSFWSPQPPGLGLSSFQAPPHSSTTDEVTSAQQLGFGHRVEKNTTRLTPSDSPYN